MSSLADPDTIEQLLPSFGGRVIRPGDEAYDKARTVFYGDVDRRPAAIVRPADASHVAEVVGVARDGGLELAIRSGGHSIAGHSVIDGGIVLDLADLRELDLDSQGRTAWAQTGLTAGEYTTATAKHDLATGFGDTGTVAISGLTLGGGVGFLSRAQGLTVDNLLAAEIVTADGRILEVDGENHPDLFWAMRGGGGNFGVATRLRFRLHELEGVVGGMLMLPATADVVRAFVELAEAAPDKLSTIANVMSAPPMPFIPAEHHGKLVIMGLVCYAGPAEEGERVLEPFRSLAAPIADMVKPIPYPAMFEGEGPGVGGADEDFHPTAVSRTMFLDTVEQDAAELIVERLESSDATMRVAQLRVLGGAIARVPSEATAYAHRGSPIMANVAAFYDGPEDKAVRQQWVNAFAADLRQSDTGAYVNFLGDEGPDRIRAAYPGATWDRLARVKAQYDPANLFHHNQNIPPAAV
jgi:FAD binding domain/Berberine and berberine like